MSANAYLDLLSDYAGFFGAFCATCPTIRNGYVYLKARKTIKQNARYPGTQSEDDLADANAVLEKAGHFTWFDVLFLGIGFFLLLVSFALKLASK